MYVNYAALDLVHNKQVLHKYYYHLRNLSLRKQNRSQVTTKSVKVIVYVNSEGVGWKSSDSVTDVLRRNVTGSSHLGPGERREGCELFSQEAAAC